jgi:hypothetical protein
MGNEEGEVSVKALPKDVVLCEFECLYPLLPCQFRLSELRPSSLLDTNNSDVDMKSFGEVGESPLGGCDANPPAKPMLVSKAF